MVGGIQNDVARQFHGARKFSNNQFLGRIGLGMAAGLITATMVATPARAGDRPFVFVYDATTSPAGSFEYEQSITWQGHKSEDHDFSAWLFRHEIEVGITDHLQLGLYLANWGVRSGGSVENDGPTYDTSGIELIYNLTNPTTDPIGLAIYGEYSGGPNEHSLEGKIIAQKNIGQFIFAYNGVIEAEWEEVDGQWESKGVFEQTAGASVQIIPALSVGAELVHEIEFPGWSSQGEHVVWIGPNASVRQPGWFITFAPLFQVTSVDGEPDMLFRLIFGIKF